MSLWHFPTPGGPIGRGLRPRVPRRSGGTRNWSASYGLTPGVVHKAPAMRPRSSDLSNSVEASRSAARQPSTSSPTPPKVTGRRASSGREEWQRRLSRIRLWSWLRGSCTKCSWCSCPGASQHQQPSRGLPPRVAPVGSAHPTWPVPGGRPTDSQIVKTWVTPSRRATRFS